MRLVLVTGAGASRNLGADGQPMPLMPDWSDRLCDVLDNTQQRLADAAQLRRGLDGPGFEEALGLLLRWRGVLPLARRFVGLGGGTPGTISGDVTGWLGTQEARAGIIVGLINDTLYELFGMERVDDELAKDAYSRLLDKWLDKPTSFVVATTNYDLSVDTALALTGHPVTVGFPALSGRTPQFSPRGMVDWGTDTPHSGRIPVLHLHGAVGWYEQGGRIYQHPGDRPFNTTLGTPVVLYPDPEKDPANDDSVAAVWAEFRTALDQATHVLVIGHSLHDPVLVAALAAKREHVAVLVYDGDGYEDQLARVANLLPDATAVLGEFGAEPRFQDTSVLPKWVQRNEPGRDKAPALRRPPT
jgi:hypothetical protein